MEAGSPDAFSHLPMMTPGKGSKLPVMEQAMSSENVNEQGQVEHDTNGNGNGSKKAPRVLYREEEEAKTHDPGNDKQRLYRVEKDGEVVGFAWSNSLDGALVAAARADGYTAGVNEPKGTGPLTKERAAAKLAELSDEELAELGLSRKTTKKGRKS
jgi:hypothetical protein